MLKKSELFLISEKTPTKRQLIAASEFGKSPEIISELARKLAFVREAPHQHAGVGQDRRQK